MKNTTIGVFHNEKIASSIGKKGTATDIVLYNRKTDDRIVTLICPLEDKIIPKAQIMSLIDAAIVYVESLTPGIGETILLLNSFKISKGAIVFPEYLDTDKIKSLIKGTTVEGFSLMPYDESKLLDYVLNLEPKERSLTGKIISIDHSFSVKGVGEVLLGFVQKGLLKKYDKLKLLPAGKEVVVRSIQMHDKDFEEAPAGSRVGLAIKGATVEELKRGNILCEEGQARIGQEFDLEFEKNKFYQEEIKEGAYHLSVGLQSLPITVKNANEGRIRFQADRKIAYTDSDVFLLINLNAKNLKIMGTAKPE